MYRYLFFVVCIALISALSFLNINNNKFDTIASVKNDKKHEKKDNTCFEWNNDDTTSSKTIKDRLGVKSD